MENRVISDISVIMIRIRLHHFWGSGLLLYYSVSWKQSYLSYWIWSMARRGSEPWLWQSCCCAPVQLLASSTILAKFPHSDPRLSMLQIAKERYRRVQLTELYKMRPEPKKGRTLIRMDICLRQLQLNCLWMLQSTTLERKDLAYLICY